MSRVQLCRTHRPLPNRFQRRLREVWIWMYGVWIGVNRGEDPLGEVPYNPDELRRLVAETEARWSDHERSAEAERNRMVVAVTARIERVRVDLRSNRRRTFRLRHQARRHLRDLEEHLESLYRARWEEVHIFRFCPVVLGAMTEEISSTVAGATVLGTSDMDASAPGAGRSPETSNSLTSTSPTQHQER